MVRKVQVEVLDQLAPADPRAVESRRDLRRLNAWMGHAGIVARALHSHSNDTKRRPPARRLARHEDQTGSKNGAPGREADAGQLRSGRLISELPPHRIVELGAGDGNLLSQVALQLGGRWQGTGLWLLDRQSIVAPDACRAFARAGWQVESVQAEVFDWLRQPASESVDVFVANLFLHHFAEAQLVEMFRLCAARAGMFVGVEPRRTAWALAASRLVGLIGCNEVTRYDAPVSIRAGFDGRELSQLWPAEGGWQLREGADGWFSHVFVAEKIER